MRTSVRVYHGTNVRFSQFDQNKARVANDFYGGGVAYFTDSLDVAKSYARTMFNRHGGDKFVYEVNAMFNRVFDVDAKFTGEILRKLVGSEIENFARGAGLLKLGANRADVIGRLKEGAMVLTGDQVFRGISNGMNATAKARGILLNNDFDGLRYNGGVNMGMATKHSVYLAYKADQIKILKRYIVSRTPVQTTEKAEVYSFI